jgi:hypothetical protein
MAAPEHAASPRLKNQVPHLHAPSDVPGRVLTTSARQIQRRERRVGYQQVPHAAFKVRRDI